MVLFKEDEKRIKEMERQEKLAKRTPLGRWVRRLIKISLLAAICIAFSLSLLRGLSGDNEALKKGIEDYISQATGLRAQIGEFTYMEFFPELELDAGEIRLYGEGKDAPLVTVGKAQFAAGFFDLMFSRRRIQTLNVQQVNIDPLLAAGKKLTLQKLALEQDTGEGAPKLVIAGQWGEEPLNAEFDMNYEAAGNDPFFSLPEKSDFTFELGRLAAEGHVVKAGTFGGVAFHFNALGTDNDRLSGVVAQEKRLFGGLVKADLTFGDSRFIMDAKRLENGLDGKAGFSVLHRDDVAILARLYQTVISYAPDLLPLGNLIDFYGWEYDLLLFVKEYHDGPVKLGHVSLPVTIENQILRAGPLSGAFGEGAFGGDLMIDARVLPAVSKGSFSLKNADYAVLGGAGGPFGVEARGEGEGKSLAALVDALKGSVLVSGGEGEIPAAELYKFLGLDGQVADTKKMQINCLLGDFSLAKGVITPAPLLIDTADGLLIGAGSAAPGKENSALRLEREGDAADIVTVDFQRVNAFNPGAATVCGKYLKKTENP